MTKPLKCQQPDRDVPKLKCNYPLPCPWHTAIIDLSDEPAELRIPLTAKNALRHRRVLEDVGNILLVGLND
jgi:hypothetical protein